MLNKKIKNPEKRVKSTKTHSKKRLHILHYDKRRTLPLYPQIHLHYTGYCLFKYWVKSSPPLLVPRPKKTLNDFLTCKLIVKYFKNKIPWLGTT